MYVNFDLWFIVDVEVRRVFGVRGVRLYEGYDFDLVGVFLLIMLFVCINII